MKTVKKAASVLLALAVGAAAAVPVFAETQDAQWKTVFDATTYDYSSAEALTITSPGYAKDADAFKIEFIMGCGTNYFDTMVYDTDGDPIFSYDYGASNDGFYPQVADRSFGDNKPTHLKSVHADGASVNNINEVRTTFTNDVSKMTITVENKNGAVDGTTHTEGEYYTVTYAHNGTVFDTEYYEGRANGFKSISCLKNSNGTDCVYAEMKIYAQPAAETKATLSAAEWESTDDNYTVDTTDSNKLTAPDGTVVYGYKATFENISSNTTYTKAKATVRKSGGSDTDVQTQENDMPSVSSDGGVVFYILSTEALDLEYSSIVLE